MPEQTEKKQQPQDKAAKDGESSAKQPMFSSKGMIVLVAAVILGGVIGMLGSGVMGKSASAEGEAEIPKRVKEIKRDTIIIDGPTLSVRDGAGGSISCRVRNIYIVVDPELTPDERETLEKNIKDWEIEIQLKLSGYLMREGYENLNTPGIIRTTLANELHAEILRLLQVTQKEIRQVNIESPDFH